MSFVDPPFRFRFREGLYVRSAIQVGCIHDVRGIGVGDEKDCDQNVDHKIHRGDVVIMDDDAVGRLLFGLLLLFFNPFRNWMRSEFHWRDYKPARMSGRLRCQSMNFDC